LTFVDRDDDAVLENCGSLREGNVISNEFLKIARQVAEPLTGSEDKLSYLIFSYQLFTVSFTNQGHTDTLFFTNFLIHILFLVLNDLALKIKVVEIQSP